MTWRQTFGAHVADVCAAIDFALDRSAAAGEPFDGVIFHAGHDRMWHADDQAVPFHTVPHFARLAPVPGPDHLVRYRPGDRPRLARVVPRDYWHEPPASDAWLDGHPWAEVLDVTTVANAADAAEAVADGPRLAYIGDDPSVAERLGLPAKAVEPEALLHALDWTRAAKTPYEVECLRAAGRRAAEGHAAVRDLAATGATERQLHAAYLEATDQLEQQTPYGNIIAWDEASAVLHYQSKRSTAPDPGHVLLIDAGASVLGYHSDITRTWTRGDGHPVFRALVDGVSALQRRMVDAVGPGVSYPDLHRAAAREITALLCETGVLRGGVDEAVERRLAFPFFPHGLGHHLGLQVHDVGGKLAAPDGSAVPSPEDAPHLRTTRTLEAGHVVTIEPGLYFIPMLLEPHRGDDAFDWALVDALTPCGGIRIEDDVLVTADGREDLTRPFIDQQCLDRRLRGRAGR